MRSSVSSLLVVVLSTFATSVLAFAQIVSSPVASLNAPSGNSSATFVYVSTQKGSNYEVSAYSAASNGELAPVSGSPFAANANYMALNGKYLFGSNGVDIYSFSIASDGALTQVASLNAQNYNQNGCGGPENLFVDRTGTTLYDPDYLGNICANNAYQAFSIDSASGALNYLGAAVASPAFNSPLSFIGDNLFGYSSDCYRSMPGIYGYARATDGTLTQTSGLAAPIPAAPSGSYYCPYLSATDSAGHVVIPLLPTSNSTWQPSGALQIAVYTADSSGNLTTSGTAANMPKSAVGSVTDIRISPSGKLIAVAGTSGLQLFHFNGANPVTRFTSLIATGQVDHIFWDNANHLYAISTSAGRLMVFIVGATGVTPAAGSPYTIANPQNIAVLTR